MAIDPIWAGVVGAIGGAIVPSVTQLVLVHLSPKVAEKTEVRKLQREVYGDALACLQNCMNSVHLPLEQRSVMVELARVNNLISTYAEKSVAQAFNSYYFMLVRSNIDLKDGSKISVSLPRDEHKKFQLKIVNAIRKDCGQEPLAEFEMTGIQIPEGR
ncbi:hypothetical protein [Loktanella sp. SALINAS62]|uniref:hypothetical protein n=1 Tax=Loktanella sp. SALINAS62 TaxID=2706124 RepID=UPI001B8D5CF8|nr:hypothetical protein [Loktanella sp. SALINAS62]MBS1304320.1 hypothetical protein [Loktanella sp. SALINAS62]